MKIRFLLFLFAPLSFHVFCQNDFRSGYLIKNNNDTIYGLINYKSNYQNSLECEFKQENSSVSIIYRPYDIMAYRIENGKYYISKTVTIKGKSEPVFLEYLVDGIVDLYFLKGLTNEYYFIEKDSIFHELSNEQVQITRDERTFSVNSNQYIGVLNYLLNRSPSTLAKIKTTPFNYKSLINLTKTYHNDVCNEYECIVYSKSTKNKIYIEPFIGFIYGKLNLKTSEDYDMDFKPVVGINFRFSPEQIYYRLNLICGLNYSYNSFFQDYFNYIYEKNFPVTYRIDMNYSIIRIPLKIEYTFPFKKISPFLSLEYNNIFIINSDYKVLQIQSAVYSFEKKSVLRKYQSGFAGGTGLKYQVKETSYILLEALYEYRFPPQNTNYILDYTNVGSLIVNFGYGFKIK